MQSLQHSAVTLVAIWGLFFAGPALAAPFIYDTEFADTDWSATLVFDNTAGGVTFTATQVATGGNPGAFREITHTYTGPGGFDIAHFYESASYAPGVSGALASIDMSFDTAFFNYPGQGGSPPEAVAIYPAIRQGALVYGTVYAGPYSTSTSPTWETKTFTGLTASVFFAFAGQSQPSGTQPDFSSAGAPLYFGFITGNSSCCGGQNVTISGVDNFSVSATPVPEPATGLLVMGGLLGLSRWLGAAWE